MATSYCPSRCRQKFAEVSWRRANPVGSLRLLRSHPELMGLATIILLYQFAHQVLQSVFVLYGSYRYGWSEKRIGLTLMGCRYRLRHRTRSSRSSHGDTAARTCDVMIGIGFGAAGYAIYGIASTENIFCWAYPCLHSSGSSRQPCKG